MTVAPHDLKVGERIFVRNCKDNDANGTSTGVFNKGFNGSFTVASIVDDKTFTYGAKDTDGVTHSIGDFTSDTTTNASRTGAAGNVLPRFERNNSKSYIYIYRKTNAGKCDRRLYKKYKIQMNTLKNRLDY